MLTFAEQRRYSRDMTNGLLPSLYEDWTNRRERLEVQSMPLDEAVRAAQIRILDYLLKRYVDDPAARRAALFPLRTDVQVNQRASVVHRHLLGRAVTQTTDDASDRLSPVLKRMAAANSQADAGAPAGGSVVPFGDFKLGVRSWIPLSGLFDDWIIKRAWDCVEHDPLLPEDLVQTLCKRLYDLRVTPVLKRCRNASAAAYCVEVWLRAEHASAAEAVIVSPEHRANAVKILREKLADPESTIRLRSLRMLAHIGSLEDLGLLLDLHALPLEAYDTLYEREQLLATAAAITQRVEQEAQAAESTGIRALWR